MAEELSTTVEDLDESEDNVVTLQDVIQTEQALIADANAVLGASDDKNCTYPLVGMSIWLLMNISSSWHSIFTGLADPSFGK